MNIGHLKEKTKGSYKKTRVAIVAEGEMLRRRAYAQARVGQAAAV